MGGYNRRVSRKKALRKQKIAKRTVSVLNFDTIVYFLCENFYEKKIIGGR